MLVKSGIQKGSVVSLPRPTSKVSVKEVVCASGPSSGIQPAVTALPSVATSQSKSAVRESTSSLKSAFVKPSEGAYQVLKSCQKEPHSFATICAPAAATSWGMASSNITCEFVRSSSVITRGVAASSPVA